MADISSVSRREKLEVRREPHWQKIDSGAYLGFRKTKSGGTWLARFYHSGLPVKQVYYALGDLAAHAAGEQYAAALKQARAWLAHVGAGGLPEEITVYDCCAEYIKSIPSQAKRAEQGGRLDRILALGGDTISDVPLQKLSRAHLRIWRSALAAEPALVSRKKDGSETRRTRSEATTNRDIAPLRAALNFGLSHGYVTTDAAWKEALKPSPNVGKRRDLYLDRSQRNALIRQLPSQLAAFVRGLSMLPLRPGALAELTVADFDARTHTLRIPIDKNGGGRSLQMPPSHIKFLSALTEGRPAASPLFDAPGGVHWNKDAWKKPIKAAARAAGLSDQVTAYTFRHSTITDLVTGRQVDLFHVAQMSGTSVAMIEKHYGQLQKHHVAAALAKLA